MMHVLCEEYETVYAACLIVTSAVLGVDFGYQPTNQGKLEYIIQIEPQAVERLQSDEAIQVGLPPNLQHVEAFRIQVGEGELPHIMPTAESGRDNSQANNVQTNGVSPIPTDVPGVDFGYQPTDQGKLEYIIQIEPQAVERLKSGRAIQVGMPPGIQRVQVFRVQIGDGELPHIMPTAYEEPVDATNNHAGLMPTEAPKLNSLSDLQSEADNKPSLSGDLAQYTPRSTSELPIGATSGGSTNTGSTSTSGTGYPPIPGAAERYGTPSNSKFSVPNIPGSPYNAVQTSGSAPIASEGTTGSSNTGSTTAGTTNAGSRYGNYGTSGTGTTTSPQYGGTANNSASVTENTGATNNRWNVSSSQSTGSQPSTTNQTLGTTGPNSTTSGQTAGSTNPYRYGQSSTSPQGTTSNGNTGVVSPSNREWSTENMPSPPGTNHNNTTPGSGGSTSGNMTPPSNPGSNYPYGNGSQQQAPNNQTPGNTAPSQQDPWLVGTFNNNQNNGTSNGGSAPPLYNNQGQQGSQGTSNPYPNNNYPQQQNPYGNQYTNNGSVPSYPNYGMTQPNLGYNNAAAQNPYLMQDPRLASLPSPLSLQQQQQSLAQQLATQQQLLAQQAAAQQNKPETTVVDKKPETKEESNVKQDPVQALPSWWPLLVLGSFISIALNAFMFNMSHEYRRKYQDLLEDIRDLRALSND